MSPDVRRVQRADGPVVAEVEVPPSKSITNRALICAALVRWLLMAGA
jgi:3-phosphoshikimate 1-carboxyvinyltransferase